MCLNYDTKWIYFFRQISVCSGVWSLLFTIGLTLGILTVLVPQLRQEANSSDAVTAEQASWLPTITTYSGMPWIFILSTLSILKGRKISMFVAAISTFIGYAIFYCSSHIHMIMASQIFQGAIMAFYTTTGMIVVTEYTSAEYRGLFLPMKAATMFWGILTANTIGTFLHWRVITLVGLVSSFYSSVTVYFWPESPLWLAKQRRIHESIQSQRWISGVREDYEKELRHVAVNSQKSRKKINIRLEVINIRQAFSKKEFYKPVALSTLMFMCYLFSGKMVYTVYALDILKRITNDNSTAYTGMLTLDGVTVLSMYVGCIFSKLFKRRKLLLVCGTISATLLLVISLYLYLVDKHVVSESSYLSIALLVAFSVSVGCGPMILCLTLYSEMIPIESRTTAICLVAVAFKLTYGTLMKVSPYIFDSFGTSGTFMFFCFSSSICLIFTYFYLPETKDKTLQQIADTLMGVTSVEDATELIPNKRNEMSFVPKCIINEK